MAGKPGEGGGQGDGVDAVADDEVLPRGGHGGGEALPVVAFLYVYPPACADVRAGDVGDADGAGHPADFPVPHAVDGGRGHPE